MTEIGVRPVPMRLFANFDTDRTSTGSVPRVYTMSLCRLVMQRMVEPVSSLVVAVRLMNYKRTLRCNEFNVNIIGSKLDQQLDISFTIQYPHFVKRQANIVHILVQRRKRYKNRRIPGGFKTLAVGAINLSDVLQTSSTRELLLYSPDSRPDKEDTAPDVLGTQGIIGKFHLANCHSQPVEPQQELTVRTRRGVDKAKPSNVLAELSEEEEDESSNEDKSASDSDNDEPGTSARRQVRKRLKFDANQSGKLARQKNIKQKFVALLKKFKIQEESIVAGGTREVVVAPTSKELEALFEELDDLSDSGQDVEADKLSIVSNPRPGLRPYFASTTSKELLPTVEDQADDGTEESKDSDLDADSSSEVEMVDVLQHNEPKKALSVVSHEPVHPIVHSSTAGSLCAATTRPRHTSMIETGKSIIPRIDIATHRTLSVVDSLTLNAFGDEDLKKDDDIWLLSTETDGAFLQQLIKNHSKTFVFASQSDARQILSAVLTRIQRFCNSNSSPPHVTNIAVIGGDRYISYILRAYVDSMQKKTADWSHYIRFSLFAPPGSVIGKLLGTLEPGYEGVRDVSCSGQCQQDGISQMVELISRIFANNHRVYNVPIGETLLQFKEKRLAEEKDSTQVFVPFLAEVRVGSLIDHEDVQQQETTPRDDQIMATSPPHSPHATQQNGDAQDLQLEYWKIPTDSNSTVTVSLTTPSGKRGEMTTKSSIKSTFRSIVIEKGGASHDQAHSLSLSFHKEKRKDKVLQKLGMKHRQKSDADSPSAMQNANGVNRVICSSKHSTVSVVIDGVPWSSVRFFQTSPQWQTHVKHFPLAVPNNDREC